ncbi:MAG TPA: hypothetical protein VFE61_03740 [Candidatus Sulfotelmatobacter sp.]|nr:hypothetical protein [Candidatus Sulfotelmatobacter sp.]
MLGTITLGFSDLEICFCELRRVDAFPLRHGIRKWTAGPQVSTDKRVCGQVTPRWSATRKYSMVTIWTDGAERVSQSVPITCAIGSVWRLTV